jgi:hypothetical protein
VAASGIGIAAGWSTDDDLRIQRAAVGLVPRNA